MKKRFPYVISTEQGPFTKWLTKEQLDEELFDDAFPNGVYAVPRTDKRKYNYRAMMAYCREHGIDSAELTAEQMKRFEVK